MAILIGGTMVWRGRVLEIPDAADLRRAMEAVNRQALTLAITMLAAILPAVRITSDLWLVAALGIAGVFALVLLCLRARWTSRIRVAWECRVQESILRTMRAPAAVHVMPAAPVCLREAA